MKFVFMPLCFHWRTELKTCRTSLHSARQSLKFRKYSEKHSIRHGKSSTPYLVSIGPRGYFERTASFLRSEPLASPARSAEQCGDQKEGSLKKFQGQILNSFKRRK